MCPHAHQPGEAQLRVEPHDPAVEGVAGLAQAGGLELGERLPVEAGVVGPGVPFVVGVVAEEPVRPLQAELSLELLGAPGAGPVRDERIGSEGPLVEVPRPERHP